ncbi:Uncharacterized protein TPAR_07180, partial [Tolypocladium paradoxum]
TPDLACRRGEPAPSPEVLLFTASSAALSVCLSPHPTPDRKRAPCPLRRQLQPPAARQGPLFSVTQRELPQTFALSSSSSSRRSPDPDPPHHPSSIIRHPSSSSTPLVCALHAHPTSAVTPRQSRFLAPSPRASLLDGELDRLSLLLTRHVVVVIRHLSPPTQRCIFTSSNMSSVPRNPGLDAPVTLKVFYDGATRRAKMPLREMVPNVLEKHIRMFLHIPADTKIMVERYSDSAAAYVMLDSTNMSVYKQLYRAAKAKSKLKLRVTVLGKEEKMVPEPVSVEDEPETSQAPVEDETVNAKAETPPHAATLQTPAPTLQTPAATLQTPAATLQTPAATLPAMLAEMTLPLRTSGPHRPEMATINTPAAIDYDSSECSKHQWWGKQFENRMNYIKKTNEHLAGLATHLAERQQLRNLTPADASSKPVNGLSCTLEDEDSTSLAAPCPAKACGFAVCCNSCEKTIPDAHYHCSTCDDGDFDLCQSCVDLGITCYSNDHWLIKRSMNNGQIVNSTTETIAPKPKPTPEEKEEPKPKSSEELKRSVSVNRNYAPDLFGQPPVTRGALDVTGARWACPGNMRTCNCCVQELPEREFLHCTTCEDYDLCQACFSKDVHGHHPKHGFVPAVAGTQMPDHIKVKMGPGRNQMHHAICDGCDKYITGVRHKCLDCPDWDYCSDCIPNAHFVHAKHRFAPVYEPLADIQACPVAQPVHMGICCDGPLCSISQAYPSYIRGVRYKCAVCHDLDFCANCEANPANGHNKTHPLIKFKTPVRHVSVTTTGEHQDGKRMPAMGDRNSTVSKATETVSPPEKNSIDAVRTVVDVKPVPSSPSPKPVEETKPEPEIKQERSSTPTPEKPFREQDLRAVFIQDSVEDGTILPPNHVFEQTWVLRNEGNVAWPAGCSVKFVGGDYMGHVDSAHPAGISELVSASESTVCYAPLATGQEFSFTVLLRTPARAGKIISYWRLTTQDGFKFGHRLWCEVNVRPATAEAKPKPNAIPIQIATREEEEDCSNSSSTMIFPKLEKESPSASIHEETQTETETMTTEEKLDGEDDFEDCGDEEWDASENGFMTDEEYDILDASDEEFLEEQQKNLLKK